MNPIELLWEELDRMVRLKGPKSQTHLWQVLEEAWNAIQTETLDKLTQKMPRLCRAVIKAKGRFF